MSKEQVMDTEEKVWTITDQRTGAECPYQGGLVSITGNLRGKALTTSGGNICATYQICPGLFTDCFNM